MFLSNVFVNVLFDVVLNIKVFVFVARYGDTLIWTAV